MKRLSYLLGFFVCLPALGQAPTRVVSNIAALSGWYPSIGQPVVRVLGHTTPGDWGPAREFRWDSTNALATNAIRRATVTGVGRWIHDWDGDVQVFGALRFTTNGAAIQAAVDQAIARDSTSAIPQNPLI